jgi:hypothetical protein
MISLPWFISTDLTSNIGDAHDERQAITLGRRMPLRRIAREDQRASDPDYGLSLQRLPADELQRFFVGSGNLSEGFIVIKGEPVIGGLHGANRHYFCAHCMSWVFTRAQGIDQFVNLRPTMLDDASWFVPFIETCTKDKLPWAVTGAVRGFESFPPAAEWAALMVEYAKQLTRADAERFSSIR